MVDNDEYSSGRVFVKSRSKVKFRQQECGSEAERSPVREMQKAQAPGRASSRRYL
jgi:hypothetical protein